LDFLSDVLLLESTRFQKAFTAGHDAQGIPITSPIFRPQQPFLHIEFPNPGMDFGGAFGGREEEPVSPLGTPSDHESMRMRSSVGGTSLPSPNANDRHEQTIASSAFEEAPTVYRIRNLPLESTLISTENLLRRVLGMEPSSKLKFESLSIREDQKGMTALVSFEPTRLYLVPNKTPNEDEWPSIEIPVSEADPADFPGRPMHQRLHPPCITIDTNFKGLTVLHCPSNPNDHTIE
jgi:hypothetical protein